METVYGKNGIDLAQESGGNLAKISAAVAASGANTAPASATSVGGVYLAVPPTLTTGQFYSLLLDIAGNLKITQATMQAGENLTDNVQMVMPKAVSSSTGGWSNYNSGSALMGTAGVSVKASGGRLARATASNTSTTVACFLVAVDKATAAVNGDQVVAHEAVPALTAAGVKNSGTIDFGAIGGKVFTNGIALALSSTPHVVTLILANVGTIMAEYV